MHHPIKYLDLGALGCGALVCVCVWPDRPVTVVTINSSWEFHLLIPYPYDLCSSIIPIYYIHIYIYICIYIIYIYIYTYKYIYIYIYIHIYIYTYHNICKVPYLCFSMILRFSSLLPPWEKKTRPHRACPRWAGGCHKAKPILLKARGLSDFVCTVMAMAISYNLKLMIDGDSCWFWWWLKMLTVIITACNW